MTVVTKSDKETTIVRRPIRTSYTLDNGESVTFCHRRRWKGKVCLNSGKTVDAEE